MKKYRNFFLWLGIIAIVVMLVTFDTPYEEVWQHVQKAGGWFVAVVLLWIPIYLMNAWSWNLIIHAEKGPKVPFKEVFRLTVSGYALNYVTPVGVLGGEPYRILELKRYVGTERATSSVLLYAMMHIFSHFIFWAFSVVLFLCMYFQSMTFWMGLFLVAVSVFCGLGISLFFCGYKSGFTMKAIRIFAHVPGLKKYLNKFIEEKGDVLRKVDEQIAQVHQFHRITFHGSLWLEFCARILGCLEVWFILMILSDSVNFFDCILIQAFTSLFANLFFFMPMEMGTREGGFALAVGGLTMPATFGVLAGLLTRVRELIWIAVGVVLIKLGKK